MFGMATRVAFLRACPVARRTGMVQLCGGASGVGLRPSRPVVFCSGAGGSIPSAREGDFGSAAAVGRFSSMTASRPGDRDEDSSPGEGGGYMGHSGGRAMAGHPLPPRTVPDEILGFSCRTYMAGDSDDRYPNAHGIHPAEFKVELTVPVPLLGLSPLEEEMFIQIVGPRYQEKRQVLRLVSDRFPNRIDNKRYLVHLLENILVEARNLALEADEAA